MSSASIIYFWLHFDDNAKELIYDQCSQMEGFDVAQEVFDEAFDFDPTMLAGNSTAPAESDADSA